MLLFSWPVQIVSHREVPLLAHLQFNFIWLGGWQSPLESNKSGWRVLALHGLSFSFDQMRFIFRILELMISFKDSNFVPLKRTYLYNNADFLVACGGLLGFFMGISFLSLVEIVYFWTLRLCWNIRRSIQWLMQCQSLHAFINWNSFLSAWCLDVRWLGVRHWSMLIGLWGGSRRRNLRGFAPISRQWKMAKPFTDGYYGNRVDNRQLHRVHHHTKTSHEWHYAGAAEGQLIDRKSEYKRTSAERIQFSSFPFVEQTCRLVLEQFFASPSLPSKWDQRLLRD